MSQTQVECLWTAVRVVRGDEYRDATPPTTYPIIQALLPWRLLLGYDSTGQPVFVNALTPEHFRNKLSIDRPQVVAALGEVSFFLCGPRSSNDDKTTPNLAVCWDYVPDRAGPALTTATLAAQSPFVLITRAGRAMASLEPSSRGCHFFHVPCDQKGLAPTRRVDPHGSWGAIEVWSWISDKLEGGEGDGLFGVVVTSLKKESAGVVLTRIEHHHSRRVPIHPNVWLTDCNGGYTKEDESGLRTKAQAALAYELAAREVFLHLSDWARSYTAQGAIIKLMGFETNNPYHDDHRGHGSHFHVAIRWPKPPAGEKPLLGQLDSTPHIYLDQSGRISSLGWGWQLGSHFLFADQNGVLHMMPMVRVFNRLSGGCLHIRQTRQNVGDPVCIWGKDLFAEGSLFALCPCPTREDPYKFSLLSVRSKNLVSISTANENSVLTQSRCGLLCGSTPPTTSEMSWRWDPRTGTAASAAATESPLCMHVRPSMQQDRDEVVLHQPGLDGSQWEILEPFSANPFRLDPTFANMFSLGIMSADDSKAEVGIYRNLNDFVGTVQVADDTTQGLLIASGTGNVRLAAAPLTIKYDPLTGAPLRG